MKPSDFEKLFFAKVKSSVAQKHQALRFTVPSSGTYANIRGWTGPSPDLVIENPNTTNTVIAEVKVAGFDRPISVSTLPSLKLMKSAYPKDFKYVLIALGEVPESLRASLADEKIELVSVTSVDDAVKKIDEIATDLDGQKVGT